MKLADDDFNDAATVLDVGGWFRPEPRATHVIDLMPWETRGARLCLDRQPAERFSPETWHQADFMQPGFRLPFADQSFDLVICGHTIEDLSDPGALLGEITRVGKRGVIECPSRLSEQTEGMRDRESPDCGHPHHYWIVESLDQTLLLYSKPDSDLTHESRWLPLRHFEALRSRSTDISVMHHRWRGALSFKFVRGEQCRRRATDFAQQCGVGAAERTLDRLTRFARRCRTRLRGRPAEDFSWWPRIVELSRPYSKIELKG